MCRQKTERKVLWDRKEISDIIKEYGYERRHYPAQTELLPQKFDKLVCIQPRAIEDSLLHQKVIINGINIHEQHFHISSVCILHLMDVP